MVVLFKNVVLYWVFVDIKHCLGIRNLLIRDPGHTTDKSFIMFEGQKLLEDRCKSDQRKTLYSPLIPVSVQFLLLIWHRTSKMSAFEFEH